MFCFNMVLFVAVGSETVFAPVYLHSQKWEVKEVQVRITMVPLSLRRCPNPSSYYTVISGDICGVIVRSKMIRMGREGRKPLRSRAISKALKASEEPLARAFPFLIFKDIAVHFRSQPVRPLKGIHPYPTYRHLNAFSCIKDTHTYFVEWLSDTIANPGPCLAVSWEDYIEYCR